MQQSWQAKSHLEVVRFVGELHRSCDLRPSVRWHWVRGHSRDLGNEAADTLAKAAARGRRDLLRDCATVSLLHATAVGMCDHRAFVVYGLRVSPFFSASLCRRVFGMLCTTFCGSLRQSSCLCLLRACILPLESCFLWCSLSLLACWQDFRVRCVDSGEFLGCVRRGCCSLVSPQCFDILLVVLRTWSVPLADVRVSVGTYPDLPVPG